MSSARLKPHLLKDARNAVAHGGRRREGEVNYAERHIQPVGSLGGNHLTHARYLERGLFYRLGNNIKRCALALLQRMVNHARAGYADVYHAVGLADAVECTCHEGVILHRVAEHNELCAAESVGIACQVRGVFNYAPHRCDGVHVNAGTRRADVHARADKIGLRHCLRNCAQQKLITLGKALVHKRRVAADKVHAAGFCRAVKRQRKGNVILRRAASGDERYRRYRDALVYDRDAELALDILARFHEPLCAAADLVVYLSAAALGILAYAVEQRYAHGDRADIEVLLVDHVDGVEYVVKAQHGGTSQLVHRVENILALNADGKAAPLAEGLEHILQICKGLGAQREVNDHHHREEALHDGLADVQNVYVVVCQRVAHSGDYADLILANDRYDCFHISSLPCDSLIS